MFLGRIVNLTVRASLAVLVVICALGAADAAWAQASPAAGQSTPAATPAEAVTPDAARRASCEKYVAFLSGRSEDSSLMKNREVEALAQRAPQLVTCGAIAKDSEDLCKLLKGKDCRQMTMVFRELRVHPKSRAFMFPECYDMHDEKWVSFCDSMLKALRSGDPKQCAATGNGESLCRALINFDASLCVPAQGLPEDLPKACKERVRTWAFLAKGLKELAEKGPAVKRAEGIGDLAPVRSWAKAALGQADACAPLAKSAMAVCASSPSVPPGAVTPAPSSVHATPAPKSPSAPDVTPGEPKVISRR